MKHVLLRINVIRYINARYINKKSHNTYINIIYIYRYVIYDTIHLTRELPWIKNIFRQDSRITKLAEQIMAASVDSLSFSCCRNERRRFRKRGRRTIRTRRERRNLVRVCRTRATTMDALFTTWRLQIAKVDLARNGDEKSPRITNNSHSRVILDLAWEVAEYLLQMFCTHRVTEPRNYIGICSF